MFETIDKGRSTGGHPAPLVFIHGAWHGAWCWDEHFLDFFADRGYHAVAINLRGHGGRPAPRTLNKCSIGDFVEDVCAVANRLPVPPVVIGHSMGGLVVQKYLETHRGPAGVLLASVPTRGANGFAMRWARRHPWKFTISAITRKSLLLLERGGGAGLRGDSKRSGRSLRRPTPRGELPCVLGWHGVEPAKT